jgi:RAS protein activator-like 2
MQYKRDIGDGIYDNHQNNNSSNQLAYFNNRYERRPSVESARTLSDSSSDAEEKIHHIKEPKRRLRSNKPDKSIEQCEKEIARLQSNVDALRRKLEDSEIKQTSDSIDAISHQSDTKIRSIISR